MKITASAILLTIFISIPACSTDYFETAGDIGQYVLPAAGLGVAIVKHDWKGCLKLTCAYAASLGVTYALKYSVKENRPIGDDHSFPSGHTSSAFCGAAFLDIRYGPAYGIPAYILASLVGWSRIESNSHYPLDVAAGAAIGVISNLVFTRHHLQNLRIVPYIEQGTVGALMTYKW